MTSETVNGYGALRSALVKASLTAGCSLGSLTVLSPQVDPYRFDTESGHRDGRWLAEQLGRAVPAHRSIHWRGLHYAIVAQGDVVKPNGETYVNDDNNWRWLVETAGKAARWLGYIPFDRISDNRNGEPFIHRKEATSPRTWISIGLHVEVPDVDDLEPVPVAGCDPRQPYCFAIFGEKASLEDVLLPIARAKQADLYLPTGEISDTLLHQIASDANDDGRPLVMFTLADCDPAGRQMSVSIGRKLQAFKDLLFPAFRFEIVEVALTVEQVHDLGLPSTPLKETERRADRWREAFGVEQTEIDALATLRPNVLREIVEHAFDPYFDRTLEARARQAEAEWRDMAQQAIDQQVNADLLAELRDEASDRLAELESAIDEINDRLRLATGRFSLPPLEVPTAEVDGDIERQALIRFDDDFVAATRALIERKSYGKA